MPTFIQGHIGQIILSLAFAIPVLIQTIADFSKTHIFNPEWLPHARFHNAAQVFQLLLTLGFILWLIWTTPVTSEARPVVALVAAAMAIVWAVPFFLGLLVPGTSFEPYPNTIPWVGPVPLNVFTAAVVIPVAVLGVLVERWEAARIVSMREVATSILGLFLLFGVLFIIGVVIMRTRFPAARGTARA